MNILTKLTVGFAGCALFSIGFCPVASATDLLDFSGTFSSAPAGTLNQTGRLSRNSVQQDWINSEPYPGVTAATTAFNYTTFTISSGSLLQYGQYVQIEFGDINGNLFASAYLNSYNPANFQTNFLGDAGASRDFAFGSIPPTPQDPRFFNVIVPAGNSLVVVVNTSAVAGLTQPFSLHVENFTDVSYTDVTAVPEPSTWALGTVGLLALGATGVARSRRARVA